MSATQPILDSIQTHLLTQVKSFAVVLFPDSVEDYVLQDEPGAILIQYVGSEFEDSNKTDLLQQRRTLSINLTVIARHQYHDDGALAMLDKVRLAIVGFRPTHCFACSIINETFIAKENALWRYQLQIKTETLQVEQQQSKDLTRLTSVHYRQPHHPLNPNLKPKPTEI
ncbi:Gp37 family protein [Pasteurella oralis]|uniref:Gp37 family protein n=1 Tax=Pasteurella oralis TaxID=1071947 RepID=A0ABW4NSG5_9PAST